MLMVEKWWKEGGGRWCKEGEEVVRRWEGGKEGEEEVRRWEGSTR